MNRLWKRGFLLIVWACMAGCGTSATHPKKPVVTQATPVASESIEVTGKAGELVQHLGLPCFAEGVANPFAKGYPALECQNGVVLVQLADGDAWPKSTWQKRVKVRGVAVEYQPLTDAEGVPVNEQGLPVQGYSQPVYFIGNAEIVSAKD